MQLNELLDKSVTHERVQVAVDDRFRKAGWWAGVAGVAALLALAVFFRDLETTTGPEFPWGWIGWVASFGYNTDLAVVVLAGIVATTVVVAVVTKGFTVADQREHYAMAAVVGGNSLAAVPLAVAAVLAAVTAVVIVVAVVVLTVVVVIAMIGFVTALAE